MLDEIRTRMSVYPRPWWVAGGWAIDLYLGRQHRPHKDVDIAVLRRDQRQLRSCFSDWALQKVVSGALEPWLPNELLQLPIHEVHAERNTERLEFLFNDTKDDVWTFRREPSISMPLERISRRSVDGTPYLCPEIVLLYKAKMPRERDIDDFNRARGTLDTDAKQWLATALNTCHPGHEWTRELELATNR